VGAPPPPPLVQGPTLGYAGMSAGHSEHELGPNPCQRWSSSNTSSNCPRTTSTGSQKHLFPTQNVTPSHHNKSCQGDTSEPCLGNAECRLHASDLPNTPGVAKLFKVGFDSTPAQEPLPKLEPHATATSRPTFSSATSPPHSDPRGPPLALCSDKPPQRCQGSIKTSIFEEVLSWRRTRKVTKDSFTTISRQQKKTTRDSINLRNLKNVIPLLLATCTTILLSSSKKFQVMASESPDRECCDNPNNPYNFDAQGVPGRPISFRPPLQTFAPPEVPDYPDSPHLEVPDHRPIPGGMITTPSSGSLGCLLSRQLCTEDSACNQILQVIPRVCGLELVACSTPTVTKCQAALRTLQSFPFFKPTCLCKEPRLDPDCNQFKDFLKDHPCLNAKYKEPEIFPVDALATCDHAQEICNNNPTCRQRIRDFTTSCPVTKDQCVMTDVPSCHSSWQNLRQSPIFGCFCPSNMRNKEACDQIFEIVNANDCIDAQLPDTLRPTYTNLAKAAAFWNHWYQNLGIEQVTVGHHRTTRHTISVDDDPPVRTSTPYNLPTTADRKLGGDKSTSLSQKDQEVVNLQSTCHTAMDKCERDSACRPYLEQVKNKCVDSCNRDRCMATVRDFYRRIPRQHSLNIAFCLCKKYGDDDQCFRAQAVLHPSCAQNPDNWSGNEEDLPSCHSLARHCRNTKSCRLKLERYEQACSVDSETKTCAGTYSNCRDAMVEILGTDLRTNCACSGAAGDFRELFECIEYKRLFWVNPCVVDAQKDFHLNSESLDGASITPGWQTSNGLTPRLTPPPTRPPTTKRRDPPTRRTRPPTRRTRPPSVRPTPRTKEITTITTITEEITTTTTTTSTTSTTTTTATSTTTTSSTEARPSPTTTTTYRSMVIATQPYTVLTPPPRTTRKPPIARTRRTRRPNRGTTAGLNTTTATTLPPKYCSLYQTEWQDENVKYIREGFEKRLYPEAKDESYLCGCIEGSVLKCTMLSPIKPKPCNTHNAFYSHASPFYLAYRGQCLCYSGEFICAKHDIHKGKPKFNPNKAPAPEQPPGVFLYLGYSKKDMVYLTSARNEIQDGKLIPSSEEEEREEVKNTIQQTVSHFTSNMNKTDCRISLIDRIGENYILKATLDEFDNFRLKKNMSDFMKWKEKDECYGALQSIASKVNNRDADMRSHVVLSMFKVAAAEANVPDPPPSASSKLEVSITAFISSFLLVYLQILLFS